MKENNYCKGQRHEFLKNDYRGYRHKVSITTVSQLSEETIKPANKPIAEETTIFFIVLVEGT